jgi:uncharacterized repeat protein (TIGR03803 family)
MQDNMANCHVVFSPPARLERLSRRSFRAMIHKTIIHQTMIHQKCSSRLISLCSLLAVALTLAVPASAEWKEKVLYSFQGGTDGAGPAGGVVFGPDGSLYGATQFGGADNCSPMAACGAVFQVTPQKDGSWTETVLYVFKGKASNDGEYPEGGLIADSAGNLYGTTAYGGTGDCVLLGIKGGCGTVYELSPPAEHGGAWTETILYSFLTAKQGYVPNGDLVFDGGGNLYGATTYGGGKGETCDSFYGGNCGAVFELSPPKTKGGKWAEKVLHAFGGGTDGANPNGGLVSDSKGNVYGTTYMGGDHNCNYQDETGCGTIFKLSPPVKKGAAWLEKQLHVFTGGGDGGQPNGGLVLNPKGLLYGTAGGGNVSGGGIAFQLTETSSGRWKETVLHWFSNNGPGAFTAGLMSDSSGDLYGPTAEGAEFRGAVVRLRHPAKKGGAWVPTVLYTFQGSPDGAGPAARLIFDGHGGLYGTTEGGGNAGDGTVFSVWP